MYSRKGFSKMLLGHYDHTLVALSIFIAISAAYAALSVAERIVASVGRMRQLWMSLGAFAMGFAIWSMHYVGMLAFRLPIAVRYNIPLVVWSMVAAVVSSAIALAFTSRPTLSRTRLVLGSVYMGSAIAAMHYIGMAAMRASCVCVYSWPLVALSILIAITVSGVALSTLRVQASITRFRRIGASVILGSAISSMHYTGMAAAHFFPSTSSVSRDMTLGVSWLGAIAISGVALLTLALALIATLAGRFYTRQSNKLASTEERYRLLFERSFCATYRCNIEGNIIEGNSAFLRLVGFDRLSDLAGQPLASLLTEDGRLSYLHSLRHTGSVASCETQIRRPDGSLVWVIAAGSVIHSPGFPAEIQGMFLNIQELKRKEAELKTATLQAQIASQAKTQFLANMSHELRTPLVAILGMAEIMNSSDTTKEQQECLEVIRDSADSLLTLIGKILEYAGKGTLNQRAGNEFFSLTELLERKLEAVRPSVERKGLVLRFEDTLNPGARYLGNPRQLRIVLRALLDNAIKFTEEGEIVLTTSTRGHSSTAEFVRISVRDTGIGIPSELHKSIFEPFNQVDSSNTRRFGGAGIGLSLARQAIHAMGGEILVDSSPGSGSTFTIDLALRRDALPPTLSDEGGYGNTRYENVGRHGA
jgi:PAS domain S-box-containing protein